MKNVLFVLIFIVPINLLSQITLTTNDLEGNWDYYLYGLKEKNQVVFKTDGFVIGLKQNGQKLKYVLDNNIMVLYGWGEDQDYTKQEAVFVLYPSEDKKTIKVKKFTPVGLADLNMKFVWNAKKMPKSPQETINQDVGGGLSGRDAVKKADIVNLTQASGTVVIRTCVNPDGDLLETIFSTSGSTTTNKKLIQLAIDGAKMYKFKKNIYAPDKQCGTIIFHFLPN